MSNVDMMLLGVLMIKPMNAYEMKKEMEYRNINEWVKISSPSVYKNLVKLYKSRFVDSEVVREGEMPEKTIYTINDKGRQYFMQLMHKSSEEPEKIYVDFSAFIANIHNVDYESSLKMIENLQNVLDLRRDFTNNQLKIKGGTNFYAKAIIELNLQMNNLCCTWLEDFKKQYTEHLKNS